MKHIAVLTSGGDAPGMNAAVRAVVRTATFHKIKISGIDRGYQGLIDNKIKELGPRDVANTIQHGGTVLRSARCKEFYNKEGRVKGAENLKKRNIDGVVVIGGDGSFRGAHCLYEEHGIAVVGVPGTIDNDIAGAKVTIGFDTAMNTALEAADKIKDTAASHDRLFLVEVMGRSSGEIALNVGIASGAEIILVPEVSFTLDEITKKLNALIEKGKSSSIVVVAEGAYKGGAMALSQDLQEQTSYEVRTTILGHIQRGGSPSTSDRVLASQLGYFAVQALLESKSDVMIGEAESKMVTTPLKNTWEKKKNINSDLYEISEVLAI